MRYINDDLSDKDLLLSLETNYKFDFIFHEAAIPDTTVLEQELMIEREDIIMASIKAMNLKRAESKLTIKRN